MTHNQVMVIAASAAYQNDAEQLAARLRLNEADDSSQPDYLLRVGERLELVPVPAQRHGPVAVDFLAGAQQYRRRAGGQFQESLAKAVGVTPQRQPSVIDATAGLGVDAFVLASLGATVHLLERSAIIAALLADGLQRAEADQATAPIVARMKLVSADANAYLADDQAPQADVVYLDPMFPARSKSAAIKKEMQCLQVLVGHDTDASSLLPLALAKARHRVVVKRAAKAPWLDDRSPSFSRPGKACRFDVYVVQKF